MRWYFGHTGLKNVIEVNFIYFFLRLSCDYEEVKVPSGPTIFLSMGYMPAWLYTHKVLTIWSQLIISLLCYPQINVTRKPAQIGPRGNKIITWAILLLTCKVRLGGKER